MAAVATSEPRRYDWAYLALACVAFVLCSLAGIVTEPPLGRVQGRALDSYLRPVVNARVWLTPARGGKPTYATVARTRSDGTFTLNAVPAGSYIVSASSKAHGLSGPVVDVEEGRVTPVALRLTRSFEPLTCSVPMRTYLPSEPVRVTVTGYRLRQDETDPPMSLTVSRLDMEKVLATGALRQYRDVYSSYSPSSSVPAPLLSVSAKVAEHRPDLSRTDVEGHFDLRVPLGSLDAGSYLAMVRYGTSFAYTAFVVTDLGVIVKMEDGRAHGFVVDLMAGKPVQGALLRGFAQKGAFGSMLTGPDGLATLRLPLFDINDDRWTGFLASRGTSYAWALGYDVAAGKPDHRLHVYTDRPIYRPGQKVHFKGVLRVSSGTPGAYTVPENVPVRLRAEDDSGVVLAETTAKTNAFGSFSGSFDLSPETPSGSAVIFAEVGVLRETFRFTVVSYRKPEFRVEATPRKKAYVTGETIEVDVAAQYYYGAPVAGATVHCTVMWDDLWEWEPDETDDEEDPPWWSAASEYGSVESTVTTELDPNGRCVLRIPTPSDPAGEGSRGRIAAISLEVTDSGGRMVSSSAAVRLYSGSVRLFLTPQGYVFSPGEPARFRVRAVDLASRPDPALSVELQVLREVSESAWRRAGARIRREVIARVVGVTDKDGSETLEVTVPTAGELRVVASASDPQGRKVTVTDFIWCVSGRSTALDMDYTDLAVHTDKRQYTVGDNARLLINSERTGSSVILTIESDRIHHTEVVALSGPSTVVTLPIREEYGPNVWVSVCGIHRKKYAVSTAKLRVSVPTRRLLVTVSPDAPQHKPGETTRLDITVRDERGAPVQAEASLALVDEAIYALQEDDPSAIMDAFYPTIYSTVNTIHSCEEWMFSGDKSEPVIAARRKFLDAAYWNAHIVTDEAGHATVTARLPDNLTTWRATAIVHSKRSQFGWATGQVVTNLPFHVRLGAPRFLTENDQATLTASVSNSTNQRRRAAVRLSGDGFEVMDDRLRDIEVDAGGTAIARWLVRATRPGSVTIRTDAWSSGTPRLADAMQMDLPVRPLAREITHVFAGDLVESRVRSHDFDIASGTQAAALTLRVTPSALSAIPTSVEYLLTYPYGCAEQTISGFLPNILVARLLKRLPSDTARALREALGPDADRRIKLSVRDGLSRLGRIRRFDGAIGWFENDAPDPWLTAYGLLAMGEVRRDGYPVADLMIEETTSAATALLGGASPDTRAFLILALSSVGVSATHRLQPERLGPAGLACAALAMRRLGQSGPLLQRLDASLVRSLRQSGGLAWWRPNEGRSGFEWSETMTTALAIRAALARDAQDTVADRALRYLMLARTNDCWVSTRDTAFVLMALCDFAAARPASSFAPGDVRLSVNNVPTDTVNVEPRNLLVRELVRRLPDVAVRPGVNRLSVEALGEGRPYYTVAVRTTTRGDLDKALSSVPGATLTRTYDAIRTSSFPLRGSVTVFDRVTGSVRAGTALRCRLVLTTPRELPFVMVTDPIPAGAEPSAAGDVDAEWSAWYSATDVRDDRVIFFARRVPAGKHVLEYYLRAETPGSYSILPTRLEGMYDPGLRIETPASRMEIR